MRGGKPRDRITTTTEPAGLGRVTLLHAIMSYESVTFCVFLFTVKYPRTCARLLWFVYKLAGANKRVVLFALFSIFDCFVFLCECSVSVTENW